MMAFLMRRLSIATWRRAAYGSSKPFHARIPATSTYCACTPYTYSTVAPIYGTAAQKKIIQLKMSKNLNYKQASNVERRTWDREHYEGKAKARAAAAVEGGDDSTAQTKRARLIEDTGTKAASSTTLIANLLNGDSANSNSDLYDHEEFLPADSSRPGPESSERAFLKARSRRLVDKLDSKVGSTEFVTETTSTSTTAVVTTSGGVGWHCKVCDCFLKDSLTYLDHINGRKHQRYLGYSMRAEKSTLDDVKEKLRQIAESSSKQYTPKEISSNSTNLQLDQQNLNTNSCPIEQIDLSARKNERARRRQERLKRIEMEKEQDEEEEEDEIDPEIRAMMGFSSFTKGKK